MAQTLIQVKDLKKYYNGGDVKALDGVTVDVYKGDVIAVIGPSGGGKSTFLRSLNLLETPTSGSIIFDGVDITGKKVDLPLHRQKMGMVFQHFNLFPNKTVLDNLTMAPIKIKKVPKSEAEQKAMALLQRVGLADRANDYPAPISFPAGSSSGWPLPGPWRSSRMSSVLTSPPPPWTRRWWARCWRSCRSWPSPA